MVQGFRLLSVPRRGRAHLPAGAVLPMAGETHSRSVIKSLSLRTNRNQGRPPFRRLSGEAAARLEPGHIRVLVPDPVALRLAFYMPELRFVLTPEEEGAVNTVERMPGTV